MPHSFKSEYGEVTVEEKIGQIKKSEQYIKITQECNTDALYIKKEEYSQFVDFLSNVMLEWPKS